MSELLAGWARAEITPPTGHPMAGYIARRETSSGVLNPLFVRALVLRQDELTLAVVLLDLLLISNHWADRLRARLARVLKTAPARILVAATHTHSGPLVETSPFHFSSGSCGSAARRFAVFIERRIEQAVRIASAVQPVQVRHARVMIRNVATDRNHPHRHRSQPCHVLRFAGRSSTALLGIYGCHPTVLGAGNTLFSADLHGEISRRLEKTVDVALVANGAAANISTRFTRRSQSPTELRRLAATFLRQAARARFSRVARAELSFREVRMRLPVRNLKRVRIVERRKTGRLAVVAEEARQVLRRLQASRTFSGRSIRGRIAALRIGGICLAALPFEIYLDTGEFLWNKARAVPICYANGYWGYVPSPAAAQDDYEVISSPFDARADARLRALVMRLALAGRRAGGSSGCDPEKER